MNNNGEKNNQESDISENISLKEILKSDLESKRETKDLDKIKKVKDLVKFEFEFIAIIALLYGLFRADLSNINNYLLPSVYAVILQIFITFLYITIVVISDLLYEDRFDQHIINRSYKLIFMQILSFSLLLCYVLSNQDIIWLLVIGDIVIISQCVLALVFLIAPYITKLYKTINYKFKMRKNLKS